MSKKKRSSYFCALVEGGEIVGGNPRGSNLRSSSRLGIRLGAFGLAAKGLLGFGFWVRGASGLVEPPALLSFLATKYPLNA